MGLSAVWYGADENPASPALAPRWSLGCAVAAWGTVPYPTPRCAPDSIAPGAGRSTSLHSRPGIRVNSARYLTDRYFGSTVTRELSEVFRTALLGAQLVTGRPFQGSV